MSYAHNAYVKTAIFPGIQRHSRIAPAIRLSREGGNPSIGNRKGCRYGGAAIFRGNIHELRPQRRYENRYFPGNAMKQIQLIIIMVGVFSPWLLAGGTNPPATEIQPAPKAVTAPATTRATWEPGWEATLTAARKEGQVNIYHLYGPEWRQAFTEIMAKRYSITIDAVTGRSDEVIARVMREQGNRIPNADVVLSFSPSNFFGIVQGANILQSLENALILPEVVEPNPRGGASTRYEIHFSDRQRLFGKGG